MVLGLLLLLRPGLPVHLRIGAQRCLLLLVRVCAVWAVPCWVLLRDWRSPGRSLLFLLLVILDFRRLKRNWRHPGCVTRRPAGSRLQPHLLLLLMVMHQVRRRGPDVGEVVAGILGQGWHILWQRRRCCACLPLLSWQRWQVLCS